MANFCGAIPARIAATVVRVSPVFLHQFAHQIIANTTKYRMIRNFLICFPLLEPFALEQLILRLDLRLLLTVLLFHKNTETSK